MSERERAVALYTFLREFAQLRTRTVRDVDAYEQVIWVSDIPQQPGWVTSRQAARFAELPTLRLSITARIAA